MQLATCCEREMAVFIKNKNDHRKQKFNFIIN